MSLKRTALTRKTYIRRQSTRGRKREAALRDAKETYIREHLASDSVVCICGRSVWTFNEAMEWHWHHKKRRHHCDDSPENMELWCPACHLAEHGQLTD